MPDRAVYLEHTIKALCECLRTLNRRLAEFDQPPTQGMISKVCDLHAEVAATYQILYGASDCVSDEVPFV